jgi:hypothetical protein
MRERREHYISAVFSEKEPDLDFSKLVRTSKDEFLKKPKVNDVPPPEREVVLVVGMTTNNQILASNLEKVFGFVFESGLCLDGCNLRPKFTAALVALLARVMRDNQIIKYYGLSVRLFIKEGCDEEKKYIYTTMKDLCDAARNGVDIDFDFIESQEAFRVFLQDTLRRIECGDMKAAVGAISH